MINNNRNPVRAHAAHHSVADVSSHPTLRARHVGGGALLALLLVTLVGCATGDNDPPPTQMYECLIRYQCAGSDDTIAREFHTCAGDNTEARRAGTAAGFEIMAARCANGPSWTRVSCEAFTPTEACEP